MPLQNKIWNIAASVGFADVLAGKLIEDYRGRELELADVLVLLPNRRACKTLADAFVRLRGMTPTLLPHLRPIGDPDEDEIILQDSLAFESMPPAVSETERLLLFMKIILSRPGDFGTGKISAEQACYLARDLGTLIDMAYYHDLDFSRLKDLVPEEYAAHWQETLKFLEIITAYWPKILQERGKTDASFRKKMLLEKQAEIWTKNKPCRQIILAGTTAGFTAMKKIVRAVLDLPQGEVYLSGLDRWMSEEAWAAVDEGHPQFELKELLDFLGLKRSDVQELRRPENPLRERLVSEIMLPAAETDKWREAAQRDVCLSDFQHLSLLECDEIRQEALAIAAKMREVLETPEKTAALVTPDRNLARRVAAQLKRWKIEVDDSGGVPLAATAWGMFMRLILKAATPTATRTEILALLKNPLTGMGQNYAVVRTRARELEQNIWRAGQSEVGADSILNALDDILAELKELYTKSAVQPKALLRAHIGAAERLAATDTKDGRQLLWRGDAGESGAVLLAQWLENADLSGEIGPSEYAGLFEAMIAGKMVRPRYGTHPRLSILGPIEARLNRFDVTIIGEVNEGIWPQLPGADPWMSRPMKKEFGFPLPERNIGVLGFDFAQLLCGKEVYLTRAGRVQGTPMMKSRWWMRLQAVAEAVGLKAERLTDKNLLSLVRLLEEPDKFETLQPPAPKPPFAARPRRLSVSGIELLMRDPYSVFARYILKLQPLKKIEPELTKADYGIIIHGILEEFNHKYPRQFPENAKEELLALGRRCFAENRLANEKKVFWWPQFEQIIEHLIALETVYRDDILQIHSEISGKMEIETGGGKFVITAEADRIDETRDGQINIIDYKTGEARSVKQVKSGFAPQLPLEGLIAEAGGFDGVKAAKVNKLLYWQLGVKNIDIDGDISKLLAETKQNVTELITLYDLESTPYECHPNLKKNPAFEIYAHLARVKEWGSYDN